MPNDEILPHARALSEETARKLIDTLDRRGAWMPVRRIRRRYVLDAFDREVEILDPGREDLAEYAPGVGDAELHFWLR